MSRKSKRQWDNDFLYNNLHAHYENIGTSMWKWEGLPDYVNPKYPEQTLYEDGMCVAMKPDNQDNIYLLPVKYQSLRLDPYGDPIQWEAYAVQGSRLAKAINGKKLNADNSVLIWNDPKRRPSFPYVDIIIKKMVNIEATIDTNILVQQLPIMFSSTNQQILNVKNLYQKIVDREPAIFNNVDYRNGEAPFEVITPNVPFLADVLSDQYSVYDNRILESFGIEHVSVEKKERLLTGEVDVSGTKCAIVRKARKDQRDLACKRFNEVFGMSVSCEYDDSEIRRLTQSADNGGASREPSETDS